jgi:glycosyltransferase involved in cell wall biosynthesis
MKLAILGTRGIPARYGGFETFAQELSIRLVAKGVDVTVYCPASSTKPDEEYRGVRLKYVKLPRLGPFDQMFWDAECFCHSAGHFDVVYMLGMGGAFAAWVPRMWGSRVWINTDGVEWRRTKWNLIQRSYVMLVEALSVLFSSRVIADSRAIEDYLHQRYRGVARVSTISYGAYPVRERPDSSTLRELELVPSEYYAVVCRLEPENNVLEIIEGFEASTSRLPLVIVGDVSRQNSYVRQLLQHETDRVRFVGTIYDHARLVALRYHSRAYFHGHSVGGTNPSLLEAMACSNLVIAHDNPFNREVLSDAGLYFRSPQDLGSVIASIERAEIDESTLKRKAFERIICHYRWETIAEAYLQLLKKS